MKIVAKTAIVLATIGALGCVSTAAYAADPVTLPAGNVIYQANYNEEPAALWTTASDGTATLVGVPGTTGLNDVTDGAWNPVTGKAYVVGNGYNGPCELWEANMTTGQFSFIADITGDDGDTYNCDAFDIAPDGTAWITMYDEDETATLAKLNLADGTTSDAVSLTGLVSGVTWIVVQPSTGTMFLSDWDHSLFTVDTSTGAVTLVVDGATVPDVSSYYDAAFDSAGRLWITAWPDNTVLYSADVADFAGSLVSQGDILIGGSGDQTGTDSLWIVRGAAPALANTGADATGALALGLGLLALGAGVFTIRRLRRTAPAN